jgi:hypothetical protein
MPFFEKPRDALRQELVQHADLFERLASFRQRVSEFEQREFSADN